MLLEPWRGIHGGGGSHRAKRKVYAIRQPQLGRSSRGQGGCAEPTERQRQCSVSTLAAYMTTGSVTTGGPDSLPIWANLRAERDALRRSVASLIRARKEALWILTVDFNMVTAKEDRANFNTVGNSGGKDSLETKTLAQYGGKQFGLYEIYQPLHTNRYAGGHSEAERGLCQPACRGSVGPHNGLCCSKVAAIFVHT